MHIYFAWRCYVIYCRLKSRAYSQYCEDVVDIGRGWVELPAATMHGVCDHILCIVSQPRVSVPSGSLTFHSTSSFAASYILLALPLSVIFPLWPPHLSRSISGSLWFDRTAFLSNLLIVYSDTFYWLSELLQGLVLRALHSFFFSKYK